MIVLDCNAVLAMAVGSKEGEALAALSLEGEKSVAPDVVYAELVHVLAKQVRGGFLSQEEAMRVGGTALSFVDEVITSSELWVEATTESLRLEHSSYDMLYFVLARREAATLFTLDLKLQKLCLDNGVNCVLMDSEF